MSLFRAAARAWSPLLACLALLSSVLVLLAVPAARAADDFLDPDQAFQVSAKVLDDHRIELDYTIAPGYYLYRERFKFVAPAGVTMGEPKLPAGKKHYDTALEQNVETYTTAVAVVLPFTAGPAAFDLAATHQGCAERGLCYPPQPRTVHVALKGLGAADNAVTVAKPADDAPGATAANPAAAITGGAAGTSSSSLAVNSSAAAAPSVFAQFKAGGTGASAASAAAQATASASPSAPSGAPAVPDDNQRLSDALNGAHLWLILTIAFGLGLGLALTPCVWPMLPILSAIIVGQGQTVTRGRGLALAASYSLGMALVYTLLGVAAGLLGEGLAGYLQQPAVLVSFGVLLALLSLSMFGVYELQLPSFLRDRLNARNESLRGGQMGGVFVMGVLSALIVSPCVSAPLAGVLLYIGQKHDALLGGLGLFMIAAGMSVPLLVIGASAGALLPRSGAWMDRVKMLFGLLLLAVAIYIMQPALPSLVALLLWGLLGVVGGTALGAFEPAHAGPHVGVSRLFRGVALVMVVMGVLEFIGLASGGRDPGEPLSRLARAGVTEAVGASRSDGAAPHFDRVMSVADLDQRLQAAGKPVMLDFYADWCVSCKEMEAQTFSDPAVRARLDQAVLLRADVTANSADDRALLKRFNLFGPPGIIFFDAQGHEAEGKRVVGSQDPARFLQSLSSAGL